MEDPTEMNEVIALHGYEKTNKADLSFEKNERLLILQKMTGRKWARARNKKGEVGLIPINYVELESEPAWYHGPISREDAESLLEGYRPGTFLIRKSHHFAGDFTLCLVTEASPERQDNCSEALSERRIPETVTGGRSELPVQHYHIRTRSDAGSQNPPPRTFSLDEQIWFPSLRQLVDFYKAPDRGLAHELGLPIPDRQREREQFLRPRYWLDWDSLQLAELLGHGDFGEVFKGTFKRRHVAIKHYKQSAQLQLVYEACIMADLLHPNLVRLVGLTKSSDSTFYLVTEYLAGGSLLHYLHSRGRAQLSPDHLLSFAVDVARGLEYMERRGFVHRDVAARNVLLSDSQPCPQAKVGDFGLSLYTRALDASVSPLSSHRLYSGAPSAAGRIPIKWTAPEAIRSRIFSHKTDVWSYGVLLWEIYSFGRIPYPRLMTYQVLAHLESGERMEAPEGCPPELHQVMLATWHHEPSNRPPFSALLKQLLDFQQPQRVPSRATQPPRAATSPPAPAHCPAFRLLPRLDASRHMDTKAFASVETL